MCLQAIILKYALHKSLYSAAAFKKYGLAMYTLHQVFLDVKEAGLSKGNGKS